MSDDNLIRRGEVLEFLDLIAAPNESVTLRLGGTSESVTFAEIIAAIAALPAVVPTVKVKPLVWKPRRAFDGDFVAKTPFGQYSVGCIHGDWMWFFEYIQDSVDKTAKGRRSTERGAKSAAQADYKARILAALDVQPAPPSPHGRAGNE